MSPRLVAPLQPGLHVVTGVARRLSRWSVTSQQAARRNAMLACTAAAARRVEREEVAEFLRAIDTPGDADRTARG